MNRERPDGSAHPSQPVNSYAPDPSAIPHSTRQLFRISFSPAPPTSHTAATPRLFHRPPRKQPLHGVPSILLTFLRRRGRCRYAPPPRPELYQNCLSVVVNDMSTSQWVISRPDRSRLQANGHVRLWIKVFCHVVRLRFPPEGSNPQNRKRRLLYQNFSHRAEKRPVSSAGGVARQPSTSSRPS